MFRIAGALLFGFTCLAADFPPPVEHTFTIHDFKFHDGETLPELTLHYYTIGQARESLQFAQAQRGSASPSEP